MRKFFLAACAFAAISAVGLADPVRLVKFDEDTKTITVKDAKDKDGEEKKHVLGDKVKFTDGDKDLTAEEAFKRMSGKKAVRNFDLTVDKNGKVESVKFMAKKAKKTEKSDK